jgi:ubiquinone/menaquinone biosynthesis C-methylase UbiE
MIARNPIDKIYNWFHNATSRPEEKGEYSSGYWQDLIRKNAKDMCRAREGRLLDVGCGEGLFLAQAVKEFPDMEFWGVDGWAEILTRAEKRILPLKSGVKLMKADASSLSFEDDYFDTIVCVNVFFNMGSINKVQHSLKEITRVCKRGGSVIFDFRNALNPLLVLKYRFARYYDSTVKNLHLNTYRPGSIRAIVNESGLEIVQERHLSFPFKMFAPIIMIEAVKK